jgi:CDP-ribitol ribitolphosphotransferase
MNMHKNYDAILASSKIAKNNSAEAFNVKKNKVVIMGLPRIDFLQSEEHKEATMAKIMKEYPQLDNGKQQVVYVPTFRKNTADGVRVHDIVDKLDYTKYNLIVKLHHDKENIYVDNKENVITGNAATGMEFLHIADYVITDYSAISFEALIAGKPVYFYVYDYEKYKNTRDMYIDFKSEMPGIVSEDSEEILQAIYNNVRFDIKAQKFIKKYVSTVDKDNTKELAKYILNML